MIARDKQIERGIELIMRIADEYAEPKKWMGSERNDFKAAMQWIKAWARLPDETTTKLRLTKDLP